MTERILDISEEPAYLKVKLNNLVIERKDKDPVSVHLPEIAALVTAHKQVTFSQAALAGVASNGGIVVFCDEKFLPVGMVLPLVGHTLQSERFAKQVNAPVPTKKRIWKQIITAKVVAQGRLLQEEHGEDFGLMALSGKVRSGDTGGIESRAARIYWQALFGDSGFRRHRDGEDQNRYLNYGYAVLRALVSRALCASGLHPSLGVHHHNRYDAFCLSDDVMEPFRPLVDRAVLGIIRNVGTDAKMDPGVRADLVKPLLGRFLVEKESRTLFDVLTRLSASLVEVFAGTQEKIILPDI